MLQNRINMVNIDKNRADKYKNRGTCTRNFALYYTKMLYCYNDNEISIKHICQRKVYNTI